MKPPLDIQPYIWGRTCQPPFTLIPQLTRALEGHHPAGGQDGVLTSSRISAFAFPFVLHAELSEAGNQNILTGCQG